MPKKVITNIDDLDLSRRYTYGDYLMWRFQERVELIRGWIARMSKAPKLKHQKTSMELVRSFLRSVNERPGGCHVFAAPFDVILVEAGGRPEEAESVVQPDLCVRHRCGPRAPSPGAAQRPGPGRGAPCRCGLRHRQADVHRARSGPLILGRSVPTGDHRSHILIRASRIVGDDASSTGGRSGIARIVYLD